MNNKTAFLIFAQTTDFESKQIPNADVLFDKLNFDILKKVKQTNVPYFISNEKDQVGNTFGEKLTNAISKVFALGYDYVVTVGNDTPEITTGILNKAVKNTLDHKLTIGPSKDGGTYLMTFFKEEFTANLFKNLPWKTSALGRKITKVIKKNTQTNLVVLSPLRDIDTFLDLKGVFLNHTTLSLSLRELFKMLVFILKSNHYHKEDSLLSFNGLSIYNKGSPYCSFS